MRNALALLFAVAFLNSFALAAQELRVVQDLDTITVTGNGEVDAEPDRAVVRLGVVAQAPAANAAQAQVNEKLQRVIEKILALEIPKQNVRTTNVQLHPVYSQRPNPRGGEPEEPRITGYRASNSIEITVDNLKRVGDVADAAIAAGANQVEQISFQLKDNQDAQRRALQKAAGDARSKATAIAAAMGVELGRVVEVVEGGASIPRPMFRAARGAAMMAAEAGTPIQPGQLQINASVTVQYQIERQRGRQ